MTTYRLTATLVLHEAIPPDDALLRLRRVLASESEGVRDITLEPVLRCEPPAIHVYVDAYNRCECQRRERFVRIPQ